MRNLEWEDWEWSGCASSQTLERLTIDHRYWAEHNLESFTFDTPSLTYLKYIDFVPEEYPVVNLDSIVEAKLHLILTGNQDYPVRYLGREDDPITSNPTNLIKGLRNVEILHLSTATAQVIKCVWFLLFLQCLNKRKMKRRIKRASQVT